MAAAFLDLADDRVQTFLWNHIVATDVRHDYTRADAFKLIYDEICRGDQVLVGDLDQDVVLRCWFRNPKVVEIHVMGTAMNFAKVFPDCIALAWKIGVEKIMAWLHHRSLGKICERYGFVQEGCFRRMHLAGGELHDLYVYSLERPAHA